MSVNSCATTTSTPSSPLEYQSVPMQDTKLAFSWENLLKEQLMGHKNIPIELVSSSSSPTRPRQTHSGYYPSWGAYDAHQSQLPAQITFLRPSMFTSVLMLIPRGVPLPLDPWERSRELWSTAIMDVAISVSLFWRCFCAVCNTVVAEVILFVVGDGGVVDCVDAGFGC